MNVVNEFEMKHYNHAHVDKDGSVRLYYAKRDKDSGQYVTWQVVPEFKVKVYVHGRETGIVKFGWLCFMSEVAKLLRYTLKIEVYMKSNSDESPVGRAGMQESSIILYLSDGSELQFGTLWDLSDGCVITEGRVCMVSAIG